MDIGIIGFGNVGQALAKVWHARGHRLMVSYTHNPARRQQQMEEMGLAATIGTPREVGWFGEVVLLAVPFPQVRQALNATSGLAGKVLLDCTNPWNQPMTRSAAEEIADWASQAHVVKAYCNVPANLMDAHAFANRQGPPALVYCGNDGLAKRVVARLIVDSGFMPVDAGSLQSARYLEAMTPLWFAIRQAGFSDEFLFDIRRLEASGG